MVEGQRKLRAASHVFPSDYDNYCSVLAVSQLLIVAHTAKPLLMRGALLVHWLPLHKRGGQQAKRWQQPWPTYWLNTTIMLSWILHTLSFCTGGETETHKKWKKYIFRTTEEIQSGELQWPFWTKLVMVAIGFTGMILILSKELQLSNKLLWILKYPLWALIYLSLCAGGLVFMYIQCKVYIQICRKWRAFNRTIVVQVRSTCSLYLILY